MLFLADTPDLNETDLAIYQRVTNHFADIEHVSIRQLAAESNTSTASVLRFCKKFGTTGFSEFKIRLAAYIHAHDTAPRDTETIVSPELINFFSRFQDTYYREKIDEAVSLLLEKELILFLGLGSSNIIAEYGALYFSSIFNMAVRIEDPNNYPVAHMSPEIARRTCIVALSVSGETREIVDYLSHFNLTECSIISITSTGTSTVARLSDINIPYHITIEKVRDTLKDEPDITTQVPALYIVETLAREVIKQKADRQN